jgi:outer membrane protein assembly factor BamB
VHVSPIVNAGRTLFLCQDRYLYSLRADGTREWRYNLASRPVDCFALAEDGTVYAGTEDGRLHAVNRSGDPIWTYRPGRSRILNPALSLDGFVFLPLANGEIHSLNARGDLLWKISLNAAVSANPVIDTNGFLYIATNDGFIYAFNRWGRELWRFWIGQEAVLLALDKKGRLYAATDEKMLISLNTAGSVNWKKNTGSAAVSVLTGPGDLIVVLRDDGTLLSLTDSGEIRYPAVSSPVTAAAAYPAGTAQLLTVGEKGEELSLYHLESGRRNKIIRPNKGRILQPVCAIDGSTVFGTESWLVFGMQARLTTEEDEWTWNQKYGNSLRNGRIWQIEQYPALKHDWDNNLDYIYFLDQIDSDLSSERASVLTEIERRLENADLRGSLPYIKELLRFLSSDFPIPGSAIRFSLRQNTAAIRASSARILARIGGQDSLKHLSWLLTKEYDSYVQAEIIRGMGVCGGDPDGEALLTLDSFLKQFDENRPDQRIGEAAMSALWNISIYHGSIPHSAGVRILNHLVSGNYSRDIRTAGLNLLRELR